MAVTEYVKDCVVCASIFGFLRSSRVILVMEVIQQLSSFPSAVIIGLFAIIVAVLSIWLDKYLVRHGDVVKPGSVTDDLFRLCNSVVSIQPHNGLRQQLERYKQTSSAVHYDSLLMYLGGRVNGDETRRLLPLWKKYNYVRTFLKMYI